MSELVERLEQEFVEGTFATGGQIYCSVNGRPVIDVALGVDALGARVDRSTLFAVYCAGKPVIASAIGCLVDDGELSFDDVVGDILENWPRSRELATLSIASLMNHTAGLHLLRATPYVATPPRHRAELVASSRPPPGWHVGTDVAYGEVAAWHILNLIIQILTGKDVRTFVRQRLLGPADVEDEIYVGGMTDAEFSANRARLGVNMWIGNGTRYPMLMERSLRIRGADNAAVGSSASARGLGRFYEELLRVTRSIGAIMSRRTLEALISPGPRAYDPIMDRECRYGLGFMVSLDDHYFGSDPGPEAFGHSGNGGMTAAFADPDTGLVAAYHINGKTDAESMIGYRRPALVSQIYRESINHLVARSGEL
jgi:CubicO group peptidase (beta-lactamase class C family)